MGKAIQLLVVVAAGIAAYVAGFHQGARSEAADPNSVAQQFRGWQNLAALAWEKNPGQRTPEEIFSLAYFTETAALAFRMDQLSPRQLEEFTRKAQGMDDFMPPGLKPWSEQLAQCIAAHASGAMESTSRCIAAALPRQGVYQAVSASGSGQARGRIAPGDYIRNTP